MPGAPGICVCIQGGARQFEGRLKNRGRKIDRGQKKERKYMEKEVAVQEQTKRASATVVCCLFTLMCYLPHRSRGVLSSFADRR